MFTDWLSSTGLGLAKPVIAALVLPPVPMLALIFLGAWRWRQRARGGVTLLVLACAALWAGSCEGMADWLERTLLRPPPALDAGAREALQARARQGGRLAIVVLGGGVDRDAPEYGGPALAEPSLQRLRYGIWLGRATGIPVAVSGGGGWALRDGAPVFEADIASRIAAEEFHAPLRWAESASRDTHENALDTLALLAPAHIDEIVVVTHAWHMPRALREFRAAAAVQASPPRIVAAPIEVAPSSPRTVLQWLPSGVGARKTSLVLHELLGLVAAPRG